MSRTVELSQNHVTLPFIIFTLVQLLLYLILIGYVNKSFNRVILYVRRVNNSVSTSIEFKSYHRMKETFKLHPRVVISTDRSIEFFH